MLNPTLNCQKRIIEVEDDENVRNSLPVPLKIVADKVHHLSLSVCFENVR